MQAPRRTAMRHLLRRRLADAGLLPLADRVHLALHRIASLPANRAFLRDAPDYAVPPAALAFDAYGHLSWAEYRRSGEAHARFLVDLMQRGLASPPRRVLEWGCGPARILRALKQQAWLCTSTLTGVDVNRDTVAWCRDHVDGIEFDVCQAHPPLPFAEASFDVVYHYSVWTHLSEASVRAWSRELARVLRPGGMMIGTTHGDGYRHMLSARQQAAYAGGRSTSSAHAREGRKHYLSFHPPATLRQWLEPWFDDVRHLASPADDVRQDVWVARR